MGFPHCVLVWTATLFVSHKGPTKTGTVGKYGFVLEGERICGECLLGTGILVGGFVTVTEHGKGLMMVWGDAHLPDRTNQNSLHWPWLYLVYFLYFRNGREAQHKAYPEACSGSGVQGADTDREQVNGHHWEKHSHIHRTRKLPTPWSPGNNFSAMKSGLKRS